MFCALKYFFGHSIYFTRLRHVNPLCKHKCAFLLMKEAPHQKIQEKKPLLKFKNTKKYICLERIWKKVSGTDLLGNMSQLEGVCAPFGRGVGDCAFSRLYFRIGFRLPTIGEQGSVPTCPKTFFSPNSFQTHVFLCIFEF